MQLASFESGFAPPGAGGAGGADVFVLPATVGQQGFWYLDRQQPGNPAFNIAVRFRLEGLLRAPELDRALNEIVRRHETLRTVFDVEDDRLVQFVLPRFTMRLRRHDLRTFAESERGEQARLIAVEEARGRFDLKRGPLIRGRLVQLDADVHILLLTVHHLVADGWSIGVITQELGAIYDAYCQGLDSPLPDLVLQYGDFAAWQNTWLNGGCRGQLDYWTRQLANLPVLEVPADRPRPPVQTFDGSIESILLPRDFTDGLTAWSKREDVTPSMALLAAFQILLHRYTGQTDIFVGSVVPGRSRVELESLIGLFINPIVLRVDCAGDPPVREILARVRQTSIGAFVNQDVPFERVVEAVQPKRDPGRSPLFQINFLYQRDFVRPFSASGVQLTAIPSVSPGSMYDLNFFLVERAEGLRASCEYNTNLYDSTTVTRLLGHFRTLLEAMIAHPDRRISELPLLTEDERRQLVEWNRTKVVGPPACLHELFEAQATRTPDAAAALCHGGRLTYDQLNRRANRLAHRLRSAGVGPDSPVGIFLDRSLEMVVAILGVLKAGGACLPLDTIHPKQRLRFMVDNAKTAVLLTQSNRLDRLPIDHPTVLCLDDAAIQSPEFDDTNPTGLATPENFAYVLYTSGSTGRPKGVAMSHGPIVNLVTWEGRRAGASRPTKTLQYASFGFDVAFQEMFATWAHGGTLVVVSEQLRSDLTDLWRMIDRQRIERMFLPVVVLQQLAEAAERMGTWPRGLREVITAGEALRVTPAIRRLFKELPDCRLTNQYGPTEAHVVTCYPLNGPPETWPQLPPIGRPIDNAAIHLLDRHLQPVPIGIAGELYIAGECLARGYVNQPELTAERFVPGPAGERLYKTGDLARYRPDGVIEFLGRADGQVKIRGFRIELSEIESVISHDPTVAQCAVTSYEMNGERRLAAYVVGRSGVPVDIPALMSMLRSSLPGFMLPATIVALKELPLNANGKVDRGALPAPDTVEITQIRPTLLPRDEIEAEIARLWQETLGTSNVSVTADFFDEGGSSLLAMSLLARIKRRCDRKISLAAFLQRPTIEAVATMLREDRWEDPEQPVFPMREGGNKPPLLLIDAGPFFRPFVRALGADQPVYGVALPQIADLPNHFTTQHVAARLADAILDSSVDGPIILGGWSLAGVVAYEIARQLRERGVDVAKVVLFDTSNPAYLRGFASRRNFHKRLYFKLEKILFHFLKMRRMPLRQAWQHLRQRTNRFSLNSLKSDIVLATGTAAAPEQIEFETWKVQYLAAADYHPQPCDCPLVLVRSTDLQTGIFRDPLLGWGRLARAGLQVHVLPGEHDSMFRPPDVEKLADVVRNSLQMQNPAEAKPPDAAQTG